MLSGKRKNVIKGEASKTTAFSKAQILSSMKYRGRKDIVNVLLKDNEMYSFDEVDSLINDFMRGKVK